MGEMGWGNALILSTGAMVTTVVVTLAIQYFRIVRLKMELRSRTRRDRMEAPSTRPN